MKNIIGWEITTLSDDLERQIKFITSGVTWKWPAGTLVSVHPIVGQFDLFIFETLATCLQTKISGETNSRYEYFP